MRVLRRLATGLLVAAIAGPMALAFWFMGFAVLSRHFEPDSFALAELCSVAFITSTTGTFVGGLYGPLCVPLQNDNRDVLFAAALLGVALSVGIAFGATPAIVLGLQVDGRSSETLIAIGSLMGGAGGYLGGRMANKRYATTIE